MILYLYIMLQVFLSQCRTLVQLLFEPVLNTFTASDESTLQLMCNGICH